MFSSIKKKLQGILTASALKKKSNEILNRLSKDPDNKIAGRVSASDLREHWENWHNDSIKDIGNANNRYDQIIGLRKATIEQIEELSYTTPVVTEKYSDDDKKLLLEHLNKDKDYESVKSEHLFRYMYAQTSWQVLRYISHEFDDASPHDWTEYYKYLSDTYVEHVYDRIIKNIKGEEGALDELEDALINTIKQKRDEIREEILNGSNYEYNLEEIEKEQQAEKEKEEQEEAEEKQREDAKRIATKSMSNSQLQDLTEFMIGRYERIRNGELYKIEDYSPVNAYGALEVDSGIMLIALSECVADYETAKEGLRKVMWNFVKSIGNDQSLLGKSLGDVNIEVAEEIYNIKQENEESGWMSDVVLIAIQYLYDIILSDFTVEEQREIGKYSVNMIDDTWSVFANTKNVFGYNLNTEGMFSSK
ncbi:hypothetical protein [Halomonas sp. 25-S5]|uniref:hypothetical protein n=1 Tax=Halomonas sp. 25-S5 TaxID=2994065 RepID=UPI00246977D5|nr:hypothetical protein [Halomonas sp. 25-S5]